jgi:hypothetical protein
MGLAGANVTLHHLLVYFAPGQEDRHSVRFFSVPVVICLVLNVKSNVNAAQARRAFLARQVSEWCG